MISVTSAVDNIVASSDFAIEGLQSGCLNLSAYADTISVEVEYLAKKSVKKGSIVVALTRVSRRYRTHRIPDVRFELHNLVSRTGLAELTYPKTVSSQKQIAKLFQREDIQTAPFCVATIGLGEISIITSKALAEAVQTELDSLKPSLNLPGLSSLTMQVAIETIDVPRQSYTVIKQLAIRNITIVEYITSPTELTIILYDRDLKEAFNILHEKFFAIDKEFFV